MKQDALQDLYRRIIKLQSNLEELYAEKVLVTLSEAYSQVVSERTALLAVAAIGDDRVNTDQFKVALITLESQEKILGAQLTTVHLIMLKQILKQAHPTKLAEINKELQQALLTISTQLAKVPQVAQ